MEVDGWGKASERPWERGEVSIGGLDQGVLVSVRTTTAFAELEPDKEVKLRIVRISLWNLAGPPTMDSQQETGDGDMTDCSSIRPRLPQPTCGPPMPW